jgi:hypothetical protein
MQIDLIAGKEVRRRLATLEGRNEPQRDLRRRGEFGAHPTQALASFAALLAGHFIRGFMRGALARGLTRAAFGPNLNFTESPEPTTTVKCRLGDEALALYPGRAPLTRLSQRHNSGNPWRKQAEIWKCLEKSLAAGQTRPGDAGPPNFSSVAGSYCST